MPKFLLSIVLIMLVSACEAQQSGLQRYDDLAYTESADPWSDSLQRLNLILPADAKGCPLLIWIGGGAWAYVNRHVEMDFAERLAMEGIAVASVGHRLSPALWRDSSLNRGIKHPAHVEDVALAFKWLHEHAMEYGYDPEQIFIGGYSSGAQLSALLSVDESYLQAHGLELSDIRGVIPIAGTYDIPHYHQVFIDAGQPQMSVLHVEAVFGDNKTNWLDASPISYLDHLQVPMLLISEQNSYDYTRIFEEKLVENGFEHFDVFHVQRLNHGELWRNISHSDESLYRDLIIGFIRKNAVDEEDLRRNP